MLQDSQGFNALHLGTHSSNAMLVLFLMMAGEMDVDVADTLGHTSLMWAAYQGDSLSVDILLRQGARVDTRDREGFTPLHWAVVKGNRECLSKILKAGADVKAGDKTGKTPVDMIKELKGNVIWEKALSDAKLSSDGQTRRTPFEKVWRHLIDSIPLMAASITPLLTNSHSLLLPHYDRKPPTLSSTLYPTLLSSSRLSSWSSSRGISPCHSPLHSFWRDILDRSSFFCGQRRQTTCSRRPTTLLFSNRLHSGLDIPGSAILSLVSQVLVFCNVLLCQRRY